MEGERGKKEQNEEVARCRIPGKRKKGREVGRVREGTRGPRVSRKATKSQSGGKPEG